MRLAWRILGGALIAVCAASQAKGAQQMNPEAIKRELLSMESQEQNYNSTLHSRRQRQSVLRLADLLANAGLLSATGYIRDHVMRKYIFISQPPVDIRVPIRQSRKIRKMGQALSNTNDDDYKLAGSIMTGLADCLATGDSAGAKRQVLLLEEFYLAPDPGTKALDDNEEQLRSMADEVMGSVRTILNGFSKDAQERSLEALNLKNVLGGIDNVF